MFLHPSIRRPDARSILAARRRVRFPEAETRCPKIAATRCLLSAKSIRTSGRLAGTRSKRARRCNGRPRFNGPDRALTFSLVACDRNATSGPEWGVAVASKFLAVGSVVPWARAGAGAVATQAFAEISFGPNGLDLLAEGKSAEDVLKALTSADPRASERQVGVVDSRGRAATFTGESCFDWAGGRTGEGYCCQGNILVGERVVAESAAAFESASGYLASRLLEGLVAGDKAGGDRRGRQSAALVVVRPRGGYGGGSDVAVDLRVDDHVDPVGELKRIYEIHSLLFPRPEELVFVDIDEAIADELRSHLGKAGYEVPRGRGYDDGLKRVLFEFAGTENLEERWTDEPRIERRVLEYLRETS
jgi:uncharacterized Ntn-hydrolase superfamily protein